MNWKFLQTFYKKTENIKCMMKMNGTTADAFIHSVNMPTSTIALHTPASLGIVSAWVLNILANHSPTIFISPRTRSFSWSLLFKIWAEHYPPPNPAEGGGNTVLFFNFAENIGDTPVKLKYKHVLSGY